MWLLWILTLIAPLNVRLVEGVEGLTLHLVDGAGTVIRQIPAPSPGDYIFEEAKPGHRLEAVVQDSTVLTIPLDGLPENEPVVISVNAETVAQAAARRQQVGAQRNENIQVNLIDNNALNEQLGREGAQVRPIGEFTAVRAGYASELGGMGRNIEIIPLDRRRQLRGEVYEFHQNGTFNARTFFQVGSVRPTRRNQYGVQIGGPVTQTLSFAFSAEDVRQSGYVNGNVLVPLPDERRPRTTDPQVAAIINRYLSAYPRELPNRTEIDPRMLNTNALQTIRTTGGTLRLDWDRSPELRFGGRYAFQDTFIDSFEFVGGQNPNQRLRPQTLNLTAEWKRSPTATYRVGINYLRRKSHILVPPGAVGNNVFMSRQIEDLGPKQQFPILRARNDFEYLFQATEDRGSHRIDWGAEIRRFQMNDLQSDEFRGSVIFNANFGRTAVENLLLGTPSHYRVTLGNLYRGFRNSDFNFFINDRWKWTPRLTINLGMRYEYAGKPTEVQNLTEIPFSSDSNNFGPRIGFAFNPNPKAVIRGGYGISFGRVFPATFQWARFNPPHVLRLYIPTPDLRNPLAGYQTTPGSNARSSLNLIDPNLVVPYSQQYTLELEHPLPGGFRVRTAYIGSRTLKLFQTVYTNRGGRPEGVPVTTATVNDRRPDQRYFGIERITNMARAYFDAGQLSVERSAAGLAVRATYTFSKAIDTGSEFSSTSVNDDELRAQTLDDMVGDLRAVSRFDSPHSLVLLYSYALPGRLLKGFSLSGTTLFRSGTPFSVEAGTDAPGFGNVDGERQDRPTILDPRILGRSIDHPDTSQAQLPRSAFSTADGLRVGRGNIGRNTFRRDGIANFNLSLQRTFALDGDQARSIVFRAESINVTNHPQFDSPGFQVASPSFGQITNTLNAGRIFQFGLTFKF